MLEISRAKLLSNETVLSSWTSSKSKSMEFQSWVSLRLNNSKRLQIQVLESFVAEPTWVQADRAVRKENLSAAMPWCLVIWSKRSVVSMAVCPCCAMAAVIAFQDWETTLGIIRGIGRAASPQNHTLRASSWVHLLLSCSTRSAELRLPWLGANGSPQAPVDDLLPHPIETLRTLYCGGWFGSNHHPSLVCHKWIWYWVQTLINGAKTLRTYIKDLCILQQMDLDDSI